MSFKGIIHPQISQMNTDFVKIICAICVICG